MSAPPAENDPLHASESSSGYSDGLGTRVLGFDRESGGMLERLVLRPELTVFETMLTERIGIVGGLDDERFAKPRGLERDADDRLIVVSDYVPGRRLCDVIEAAADHGIIAGLDAGIGLLLELLPAISRIQDAGLMLGTLAPGRIVMTPAGQVVIVDAIYGEALERLQLTRKRLWSEFRLAFPPTAGLARFDRAADLAHASIVAATLTVGRPLQDGDYPDGIANLRKEIHEIASIRGSKSFADAIDKFFASTLPLAGRKNTPPSADEAAIDLRKLVRKDLGINTCRDALVEFLLQVETADAERIATDVSAPDEVARKAREDAEQAREEAERKSREEAERKAREEAERMAREKAERKAREGAERKAREDADRKAREETERRIREEAQRKMREEAERKAREEAERKAREEAERKAREEAERKAREEAERKAREEAERKAREEAERKAREEAERKAREEAKRKAREEAERKAREEAERKAREEAERKAREEAERKAREEAERKAREEAERKAREEADRKAREEADRKAREEAERRARAEAERQAREEAERKAREEAERKARDEAERQAREEVARRAREEAERKAREEEQRKAREDAERVAAAEASRKRGGWLISPENAAKFEPPVPPATPVAAAPAMASPPKPYPIYVAPPEAPAFNGSLPVTARPITEIIPSLASPSVASPSPIPLATSATSQGGIRLKGEGDTHVSPKVQQRAAPIDDVQSAADAYRYAPPMEGRQIPWKLIAAGAVLIAAVAGVWLFGPSAGPVVDTVKKAIPAKPASDPEPDAAPVAANVGRLVITTQPAGAKIQLDGKDAGETPLTLENVKPGRHTLTITGTDGVSKRTVRVEAGKVLEVDVSLYPGFVAVAAPIVVTVAEGGKVIGTSENQIILSPGRHDLRLANKELGYSATETVDITSGEVARVNVDPMGRANINAAPWAEVWVDGVKIGDTPLANVAIRLGVREIVFKNPQYPERKQTITVVGGPAATISVDFNKQ